MAVPGLLQDLQGGTAMAQGLHVASNAAEALRRNIMEEQQLYNQFLNAIRTIVLPIQSAIAIVQVPPHSNLHSNLHVLCRT